MISAARRNAGARARLWAGLAGILLASVGIARGLRAPSGGPGAAPGGYEAAGAFAGIGWLAGGGTPRPPATGPSSIDPSPAASSTPAGDPATGAPQAEAAGLQIELSHRLATGRLLVRMDGRTILSKPFDAPGGGDWGTLAHLVSVPAGRHAVEVRILGAGDELLGRAAIEGAIPPGRVAVLQVDHRPLQTPPVRLAWSGPLETLAGETVRDDRQGGDNAPNGRN